jgi:hypothetical protein
MATCTWNPWSRRFVTASGPLCFSLDGRLLAGTRWAEGQVTV